VDKTPFSLNIQDIVCVISINKGKNSIKEGQQLLMYNTDKTNQYI
jgi:hypothetical protein